MVLRFALLAGVIAATLSVVQQKQVLQNAGLFGSCSQIATPIGQSGVWHECVSGKLTGVPGLSRGSCVQIQESQRVARPKRIDAVLGRQHRRHEKDGGNGERNNGGDREAPC